MRSSAAGAAAVLAVAALVLAGCGGGGRSDGSGGGLGGEGHPGAARTVDIYWSLPLHGPASAQATALLHGMQLALSQADGRAGRFKVNLVGLDDSTAAAGRWDPTQTALNARRAAEDPGAVLYIGEFDSGASEISIPILNQVGLAELSPASTYVGLTTSEPGSAPGEPQRYYPAGRRTFLRIVPRDSIQGAALLTTMRRDGCTRVAVASDKEPYGMGLAGVLALEKGRYGVDIASRTTIDPAAPSFRALVQRIKVQGVDCLLFAGVPSTGAVELIREVGATIPHVRLYAGDPECTGATTTGSFQPGVRCTMPTLKVSAYPGGRRFLAAYRARFGTSTPDPHAILGYEAMELGLDTIARLGARGNDKSAVLAALFATQGRHSVLGTYGFDADGDTTLRSVGLYRIGASGNPVFERAVTPAGR